MAALVFMVLLLAMAGHSSASWCICKDGLSDSVLQKSLDYACGAGADCNPTKDKGPCFNPNTVRAHCSYAVNNYFQKNRQLPTACDFSGTATIVNSDPSSAGCSYPSAASASSTTTTTAPGAPGGTTPVSGTTVGGSPMVTTPSTGVLGGGINNGLGPSGINTDISDGGIRFISHAILLITLSAMLLLFW